MVSQVSKYICPNVEATANRKNKASKKYSKKSKPATIFTKPINGPNSKYRNTINRCLNSIKKSRYMNVDSAIEPFSKRV